MRLRLGRPSLAAWAGRFDLPAPPEPGRLGATWAGVSTILIDDGESGLLIDGFFSRPSLIAVALGRISPDPAQISVCSQRLLEASPSLRAIDAVVCAHSHYDHALDAAEVARATGAVLVGGLSTANIGRGAGLGEDQMIVVAPGAVWRRGPWTVRMVASAHCPPDRFPGTIDRPLIPPAKTSAYRCGEAWSILAAHRGGSRILVQGSAGFVPGALAGERAEAVYLGVGQLGLLGERYIEDYWAETVLTVRASRVVPIHWDDFFRPLPVRETDPPLRALPYAGDDLRATMRVLDRLAERDGVTVSLPTLWRREDPWATPEPSGD